MLIAIAAQFFLGYGIDRADDLFEVVVVRWFAGEDWEFGRREWRAPLEVIDDDLLLGAHIATHIVFRGALTVHVGMVLRHQLLDRDGLLRRMW
jgi:cytochrome b561